MYAFAPRPEFQPEPATVERLDGARRDASSTSRWSTASPTTPTFNKVAVSAWAERELDHETLVFTDTDCVFAGEPAELAEGDWVAAVRPVDRRIAGSRGKGKGEPYWQKMYDRARGREPPLRAHHGRPDGDPRLLEQRPGRGPPQRRAVRRLGATR